MSIPCPTHAPTSPSYPPVVGNPITVINQTIDTRPARPQFPRQSSPWILSHGYTPGTFPVARVLTPDVERPGGHGYSWGC
ncbi:uncharacterized protein LY89DRAFT_692368 [Mollisia scopiformis]|uniref:Uncharacterized protein n=1 Tax=Mollisia scopiformis TaxID=149040 RepID=A0A132B3D1_MOLSC|nr:uncharacterized protein LY89DRAFT_692368 [Mollisia scopiformis]KUJ06549.1 hypothetical protein LY89DRAFT_692368 [Mollisia scopiformis]